MLLSLTLFTISCAIEPPNSAGSASHTGVEIDPALLQKALRAEAADVAAVLQSWETGLPPAQTLHLSRVIAAEAHAAGVPPGLVLAVIEVESRGRNYAVSNAGARGLMQLLPTTGEWVAAKAELPWYGPETLFDPVVNVRLGVRYLARMIELYPNVRTALAAYNCGPGHVARRLRRGEPLPSGYVDRVFEAYTASERAT